MHATEHRWSSLMAAAALTLGLAAAGCGSSPPPTEEAEDHSAHVAGGVSRVYFVEPRDGATVRSPVLFRFGNEQYTILPVPQNEITEAEVRPGVGHYHIGVNADCLPPGEVIPQSEPWIHFGTGAESIEMELEPGTYRFSVQAGDDLHRTVEGLCETITITVAP